MKHNVLQTAEKYTKAHAQKKRWYKVVTGLACVVVFCTVYALILPAITLEQNQCSIPEHTHSQSCYTQATSVAKKAPACSAESLNLHRHTNRCYDREGNLTCGYADFVVHQHDSSCFYEDGTLWCQLPEIKVHEHSKNCYAVPEAETTAEGHSHTDACYVMERGDLACQLEESDGHQHSDECYEQRKTLICGLITELSEETEPADLELICDESEIILHEHTSDCFDESGNLTCGQIQVLRHIHSDACFETVEEPMDPETLTCSLAEGKDHTHGPLCYGAWVLSCGLEEHNHSESCSSASEANGQPPEQSFYCGKTAHVHTEECSGTCTLEEHIHSDICRTPEEEPLTQLCYEGPDYTVTVCFGADAALPEGVTLQVSEIPADSEEYQKYLSQAADVMGETGQTDTVVFARFFDIQFLLEGEKLEPAAPVEVTITYADTVGAGEEANCQAIHFAEEGTEILDVTTEQQEDGSTSFTHTQSGFSVVGDVVTVSAAFNPTDVGPDHLPVDYYVCIDGVWTCVGSTKTGWYNNWDGIEDWTNYNRDYITLAQAVSILEPYGFTGDEENPSRLTAYQQKSANLKVYSDTNTVVMPKDAADGTKILPLSRNGDHAGYNLYYLPKNTAQISGVSSPEGLDKSANGFYTVKVFDAQGAAVTSGVVLSGGSFIYDAIETSVTNWLVCYSNGSTEMYSGSTINLTNITSTATVSPQRDGAKVSHSVTFKVMIDGEWKAVGSLPYYYSGIVNGSQRAYITSDMAAQFLGDFGYTAATDPGYHFGYSYNDIYKIYYAANTGYCMDINQNSIADFTAVQLWESNTSTAQIFRIWDVDSGFSYITPVENSAFHVNVGGGGTAEGTKLILHTATDAASHWKIVSNGDGTTSFYNRNAPDSAVIDLPSGTITNGNQLQIWPNGSNRYWKLVQQYRISNSIVSAQNEDGTYNIGLTTESNGDIVCYYMPAETASTYTNISESNTSTANSFWSVRVRDDTNTVYSDGELSGMVQYLQPGAEATVTVRNADGILWSCRGVNRQRVEVESTQSGGDTAFVIKNINQPVEVTATKANPSFTVQYYANIPRLATSGGAASLHMIDTSGKKVPTNGSQLTYRYLQLERAGGTTGKNRGYATDLYRIKTNLELTKMFSDKTFRFEESPGLTYFNKLKDNENYVLQEIWVLKPGKDAASTSRNDWEIYTYSSDTAFTNEASEAIGNTILISDGGVIRLVSNSSNGDYYNDTTFYDYNIASRKNADGYWETGITGINSQANYGTSRDGQRYWDICTEKGWDLLAFGNRNCGTGLGKYQFLGCYLNGNGWGEGLNTGNTVNDWNCTFSLVEGLDSNDNLVYNGRIIAPKLFGDGDAIGKQTYAGSSLTFDRVGDTYTLSAATLKNSNGQYNTINQLQYFFNPSPANASNESTGNFPGGVTYTNIFTNDFWPMDQAASRTDPLFGDYDWAFWKSNNRYNGFNPYGQGGTVAENHYYFPKSDDGWNHNCFFGMNFFTTFYLTSDYEGPLEFYFFGDDDLWVFLDETLVCDIGGVHFSVGEYVDLRDYLPVGSSGQHKLSFFYTERGASGSTCYMSFTLPSVSSTTTSQDTGSLQIAKALEGTSGSDFSTEEYKFKVELLTSETGSALNQTFSFSRSDGTYGTVKSGGTVTLKADEIATISGIPAGTFYRVTELTTEGYHTTVNNNEGYIVSGNIETGVVKPASFVNRPYIELPNTGGAGTILYTTGGVLLLTCAALFLLYYRRKRRKENATSP